MKIVCNTDTKIKELVKLIRHMMIDTDTKNRDFQVEMICEAMGCKLVIDIVPAEKVNDGNED